MSADVFLWSFEFFVLELALTLYGRWDALDMLNIYAKGVGTFSEMDFSILRTCFARFRAVLGIAFIFWALRIFCFRTIEHSSSS